MKNPSINSKLFFWAKNILSSIFFSILCAIFVSIFMITDTYATPTPTLSASISNTNVIVNGNQVINSENKTTEIPLRLTVNTNNRTGYTATISSDSNNTALVNAGSTVLAKIDSISAPSTLASLPSNTWGYKVANTSSYSPIPALSAPISFRQTNQATSGPSTSDLSIGMKLSNNLENGSYTNRLVFSIVTNPIDRRAILMSGPEINKIFKRIHAGGYKYRIYSVRRCSYSELGRSQYYSNIADPIESDYEIKLWASPDSINIYCYNSDAPIIYANQNSSEMFSSLNFAYDIDLATIDTSEVTNMNSMFKGASSLQSLNLSSFNTSKVQNMSEMFSEVSGNGGASYMFALNLSNFNTANVVNMKGMFKSATKFTDINMSSFDTSRVTDMSEMFHTATSLTTINLSSFNFANVTDMNSMFYQTSNLQTVVVTRFNTGKVTNFKDMFWRSQITSLNTAGFETQSAVNMSGMFYGTKIPNLDLSSFNTQNVTDMSRMFEDTEYTVKLYLNNFDTRNVQDFTNMFSLSRRYAIDSLTNIYVKNDFNISSVSKQIFNVFNGRRTLRGGNGSTCSFSVYNNEVLKCLRIDRPGQPGYFTQI